MNQNQKSQQPSDQKSTQAKAPAGQGSKASADSKGQHLDQRVGSEHKDGQRSIKPKADSSLSRERETSSKA